MSGNVRVGVSEWKGAGRGLFASRAFQPHELIVEERALAVQARRSVYIESEDLVCGNCYRFIGTLDAHLEALSKVVNRPPPQKVTPSPVLPLDFLFFSPLIFIISFTK